MRALLITHNATPRLARTAVSNAAHTRLRSAAHSFAQPSLHLRSQYAYTCALLKQTAHMHGCTARQAHTCLCGWVLRCQFDLGPGCFFGIQEFLHSFDAAQMLEIISP